MKELNEKLVDRLFSHADDEDIMRLVNCGWEYICVQTGMKATYRICRIEEMTNCKTRETYEQKFRKLKEDSYANKPERI